MNRIKHFAVAALAALLASSLAFAQTAVVPSVESVSNKVQSYTASANVTLAANPNDIIALTGSATKTVYVKSLSISCVKTTAGFVNFALNKRSTANSGGTSATVTASSSDSSNSAATAVVTTWTANPTLGTGISVTQDYLFMPVTTTAVDTRPTTYTWGDQIDQYVVLRGTAQQLAVSFASAATTGGICSVTVRWLEK